MNFKSLTIAAAIVFMSSLGAVAPASAQNNMRRQLLLRGARRSGCCRPGRARSGCRCCSGHTRRQCQCGRAGSRRRQARFGCRRRRPVHALWSQPYLGDRLDRLARHPDRAGDHVGRHLVHLLHQVDRPAAHPGPGQDRSRRSSGPRPPSMKASTSCPRTPCSAALPKRASTPRTGGTSLVGMNDWIGMSLTRQLEDANGKLQGGVAFLASVGSVSPVRRSVRHRLGHPERPYRHRRRRSGFDRQGRRPGR